MSTTPNYNWPLIEPTDLVTNLPADFEDFADAVDTTVKALDDDNIKITEWVAKGDLLSASAENTPARLGVGANGTILTADSGETTGIKWASPAPAASMTQLATGTLSGSAVDLTSISGSYKDLRLIIRNFRPATDGTYLQIKFNSSTGNVYTATLNATDSNVFFTGDVAILMNEIDNGTSTSLVNLNVPDYANTSTNKIYQWAAQGNNATTPANATTRSGFGVFASTAAISSIEIKAGSGNMTSGNYILYGVQ